MRSRPTPLSSKAISWHRRARPVIHSTEFAEGRLRLHPRLTKNDTSTPRTSARLDAVRADQDVARSGREPGDALVVQQHVEIPRRTDAHPQPLSLRRELIAQRPAGGERPFVD